MYNTTSTVFIACEMHVRPASTRHSAITAVTYSAHLKCLLVHTWTVRCMAEYGSCIPPVQAMQPRLGHVPRLRAQVLRQQPRHARVSSKLCVNGLQRPLGCGVDHVQLQAAVLVTPISVQASRRVIRTRCKQARIPAR